jgi:hypothetical protein
MGKGNGQPHGGFVFVSAAGLLATWWSYKAGLIEFRDVRAWLACHELKARRCTLEKGRLPRYSEPELGRLIGGVGGEHVRVTLRRLQSASLVTWSNTSIDLRTTTESLPSDAVSFVESVRNHRRRIPVPRPLVRLLARERKPVLVATALGHLLRCMYFRKGQCEPLGLCKASWVADVFGVDERNVKAARSELEAKGVLVREQTPQLVMNRHGLAVRINLDWPGAAVESPPRPALSTTQSPRPRETGISSSRRSENQKLGAPSPSGVRKRTRGEPDIRRVTLGDLESPHRTLDLHRQAARAGYIGMCEADRLLVLALATHARVHAKRNAPGMFISAIRNRRWYLNQEDEDRARRAWTTLRDSGQLIDRSSGSKSGATVSSRDVRVLVGRSLGNAEKGSRR